MNASDLERIQDLERQLAEARTTIQALISGQIDAVVDPQSQTPVLLSNAQKALRESEERYRRIVQTTNEGICTVDAAGLVTFINRRLVEILGFPAEDLVGKPALLFMHDKNRAIAMLQLDRSRAGSFEENEVPMKRKDGSEIWVRLNTSPIRDTEGTFVGTLVMMTDATRQRQAEAALRVSEVRFRRLWDSGIILISVSDLQGRIIDINDAGLRLLGYSREELTAGELGTHDITASDWRKADAAACARLEATGIATPWEKEVVRKNGTRVSILAAAAIVDEVEQIEVAIDLSDRKRAEMHLLERMRIASLTSDVGMALTHENSLSATLSQCVEAIARYLDVAFARIWTLDRRTNVLELQASSGLPMEPCGPFGRIPAGQLRVGRIAKDRRPLLTNDLARDSRPDDPVWDGLTAFAGYPLLVNNELVGVLAAGARRPFSDPVFAGLGTVADALAVGIERKHVTSVNAALESQLRQAQKMEAVGRLAGGIAHDFNNILSVILSYGEFLLEDLPPMNPARADVEEICKAGTRAAALTRQLLMFTHQQILEPRVLDLAAVTANMENMLRRVIGEDVELVLSNDHQPGRVCVDPGSIEQVIMNLVVNARDAMPTGGRLTIETKNVILDEAPVDEHQAGAKLGPHVSLAITDTGTGMDPATTALIFEPFFTTKGVGKGTGLGLATVYGIVQQSNGTIRVRSGVGTGTTISVYLPRVDAEVDVPIGQPKSEPRGTETILLVEDEDQVRMVARAVLQRHGYRVIEMRSAAEALLYCEGAAPVDLLLTDVVMPQMSGGELARRVLEARSTVKVLCMSGYTDDSIVRHGVMEAHIAFLQKPFTSESLTRKVREVLDAPW